MPLLAIVCSEPAVTSANCLEHNRALAFSGSLKDNKAPARDTPVALFGKARTLRFALGACCVGRLDLVMAFVHPRKVILSKDQLAHFQQSKTHNDIIAYVEQLNQAVAGVKLSAECTISPVRFAL